MTRGDKTDELKKAVNRFYEKHSALRVAQASVVVGVVSLLAAYATFIVFDSGLWATFAFLLAGIFSLNFTFVYLVPPARSLGEAKELIFAAAKDPSRVVAYDKEKLQLKNESGEVVSLGSRDRKVWVNMVVPYLIAFPAVREKLPGSKFPRTLTASERKEIERRRLEVLEMEKALTEERKRIEADRAEIEARADDLNQAEEVVISRLTKVEEAEAELEQLKIIAAEQADSSAATYDPVTAAAKEVELKAKETKLSRMRDRLSEDQRTLEARQNEMALLADTMTPCLSSNEGGVEPGAQRGLERTLEEREAALKASLRELEATAKDLEERAAYVTESENALIERLDELTHREATIEQSEINSGLRRD